MEAGKAMTEMFLLKVQWNKVIMRKANMKIQVKSKFHLKNSPSLRFYMTHVKKKKNTDITIA